MLPHVCGSEVQYEVQWTKGQDLSEARLCRDSEVAQGARQEADTAVTTRCSEKARQAF